MGARKDGCGETFHLDIAALIHGECVAAGDGTPAHALVVKRVGKEIGLVLGTEEVILGILVGKVSWILGESIQYILGIRVRQENAGVFHCEMLACHLNLARREEEYRDGWIRRSRANYRSSS